MNNKRLYNYGKEEIIEETVTKLFVLDRAKWIPAIRIRRVGKQSPAHKLAWTTHRSRGRSKKVRRLSEKEIVRYIVLRKK